MGYRKDPTEHKLALVAAFGRWLEARRCKLAVLNAEKIDAFLRARKRHRVILRGDRRTLLQLLEQMRSQGEVPPPPAKTPSPLERALEEYVQRRRTPRRHCRECPAAHRGFRCCAAWSAPSPRS